MNRVCTASAVAALVLVLVLAGTLAPALAAPPTVTPSPGYDARLQDSRKAATVTNSTVVDPVTPPAPMAPRHHTKRKQ